MLKRCADAIEVKPMPTRRHLRRRNGPDDLLGPISTGLAFFALLRISRIFFRISTDMVKKSLTKEAANIGQTASGGGGNSSGGGVQAVTSSEAQQSTFRISTLLSDADIDADLLTLGLDASRQTPSVGGFSGGGHRQTSSAGLSNDSTTVMTSQNGHVDGGGAGLSGLPCVRLVIDACDPSASIERGELRHNAKSLVLSLFFANVFFF
jgi:hypothetical protein